MCQVLPHVRNFGFPFVRDSRYRAHMARRTLWTPAVPAWLVAQRGQRKQDDVITELREHGHRVSRSWLSRIENGAPFGDDLLRAFMELYQSAPPAYEEPSAGSVATDQGALNRMAEAIEALTAVLAIREGISPSDLPLAVGELAARLLGEQDARRVEAARRQAGGA